MLGVDSEGVDDRIMELFVGKCACWGLCLGCALVGLNHL